MVAFNLNEASLTCKTLSSMYLASEFPQIFLIRSQKESSFHLKMENRIVYLNSLV